MSSWAGFWMLVAVIVLVETFEETVDCAVAHVEAACASIQAEYSPEPPTP